MYGTQQPAPVAGRQGGAERAPAPVSRPVVSSITCPQALTQCFLDYAQPSQDSLIGEDASGRRLIWIKAALGLVPSVKSSRIQEQLAWRFDDIEVRIQTENMKGFIEGRQARTDRGIEEIVHARKRQPHGTSEVIP